MGKFKVGDLVIVTIPGWYSEYENRYVGIIKSTPNIHRSYYIATFRGLDHGLEEHEIELAKNHIIYNIIQDL